ncbi:sporulation protein YpjB [Virgibacillus sp. DJP39]|uniref:sporulation protein YpjB n=1 Tax=Virgibacillus sp. DJP39 TaxID=3409790 RepID=UPI003BB78897
MSIYTYSTIVNLIQGTSSLLWVIIIVGGTIIVVLAYVSWIKYKAEKKRQQRESDS